MQRKIPLDDTFANFDHHFADESYDLSEQDDDFDLLVAEDRVGHAAGISRGVRKKNIKPLWLLLLACACVALILLIVREKQQPESPSLLADHAPVVAAVETAGPVAASSPAPVNPQLTSQEQASQAQVSHASTPQVAKPPEVADKVPVVRTAEIQSIAPQKPIAKQQKTQAAKPPAKTTKPSNNGLSEKMWKAKPEHYTVQVAAAYSESGVKAVKAGLPASKPSYIRKTVKNGKPWFVLIYGSFATKEEAARARDNLPASVKKGNQPWVRKQGEVFTQ